MNRMEKHPIFYIDKIIFSCVEVNRNPFPSLCQIIFF